MQGRRHQPGRPQDRQRGDGSGSRTACRCRSGSRSPGWSPPSGRTRSGRQARSPSVTRWSSYPVHGRLRRRGDGAGAKVVVPKPAGLDVGGGRVDAAGGRHRGARAAGAQPPKPGETLLVHGAAGGVGQIAVQLAVPGRRSGHRHRRRVEPRAAAQLRRRSRSTYGPGLADRVRALAPDGVDAAIDTVGTDEAVDVSLELVRRPEAGSCRSRPSGAPTPGSVLISGGPSADPSTDDPGRRLARAAAGRGGRLAEGGRGPDLPAGRGGRGAAVRPRRARRRKGRAAPVVT